MRNPPPRHTCSFCGFDVSEVELLFRSEVGGLPPAICSDCTELYAEVARSHRAAPGKTAELIAALNAQVERRRREMRDSSSAGGAA